MSTRYSNSLGIRHLVCGSCNGCEQEMNALVSADYDMTSLGFDFVASPMHADVITTTGPMTEAMRAAATAAVATAGEPHVVIAIGDCATGAGPWQGAPHAGKGAGVELGATIAVPGCPPSPTDIIAALHEAAARLNGETTD